MSPKNIALVPWQCAVPQLKGSPVSSLGFALSVFFLSALTQLGPHKLAGLWTLPRHQLIYTLSFLSFLST